MSYRDDALISSPSYNNFSTGTQRLIIHSSMSFVYGMSDETFQTSRMRPTSII